MANGSYYYNKINVPLSFNIGLSFVAFPWQNGDNVVQDVKILSIGISASKTTLMTISDKTVNFSIFWIALGY